MNKHRESKKADPSLWGLIVALTNCDVPLKPLAAVTGEILHHEINRAAGTDIPVAATDDAKKEEVA